MDFWSCQFIYNGWIDSYSLGRCDCDGPHSSHSRSTPVGEADGFSTSPA